MNTIWEPIIKKEHQTPEISETNSTGAWQKKKKKNENNKIKQAKKKKRKTNCWSKRKGYKRRSSNSV